MRIYPIVIEATKPILNNRRNSLYVLEAIQLSFILLRTGSRIRKSYLLKEIMDSITLKALTLATGEIVLCMKTLRLSSMSLFIPRKITFYYIQPTTLHPQQLRYYRSKARLHDEVSIESSELAIEWNDLDPSLVLLTAFHQDWTYDVFPI